MLKVVNKHHVLNVGELVDALQQYDRSDSLTSEFGSVVTLIQYQDLETEEKYLEMDCEWLDDDGED